MRKRLAHGRKHIEELARTYTDAWCSRDPSHVAAHYIPGGMIAINGGDAAGIADVAQEFIAAFPDIEVFMDDLVLRDDGVVEYRWTFTGTSAETGKSVRVPGFEEWTIAPDGLIAVSRRKSRRPRDSPSLRRQRHMGSRRASNPSSGRPSAPG